MATNRAIETIDVDPELEELIAYAELYEKHHPDPRVTEKSISKDEARTQIVNCKIKDGDDPCDEKRRRELTGVSRSQWDRLSKQGKTMRALPFYIGERVFWLESELRKWTGSNQKTKRSKILD